MTSTHVVTGAILAACAICVSGCDLQNVAAAVQADATQLAQSAPQLAAAFQQDKALVEGYVADLKRGLPQDNPDYLQAQALYVRARNANDALLGKINLAVSSGDRSITPDQNPDAARSAMLDFVQSARDCISPSERGLPIAAAAIAVIPAINNVLSMLSRKHAAQAKQFINTVRWRNWDNIPPTGDESLPEPHTQRVARARPLR